MPRRPQGQEHPAVPVRSHPQCVCGHAGSRLALAGTGLFCRYVSAPADFRPITSAFKEKLCINAALTGLRAPAAANGRARIRARRTSVRTGIGWQSGTPRGSPTSSSVLTAVSRSPPPRGQLHSRWHRRAYQPEPPQQRGLRAPQLREPHTKQEIKPGFTGRQQANSPKATGNKQLEWLERGEIL